MGASLTAGRDIGLRASVRDGEWSGGAVSVLTRVAMLVGLVGANLIGALIVFATAAFVVPLPEVDDPDRLRLLNGALALVYLLAVAVPIGIVSGTRALRGVLRWLAAERAPTEREQLLVLRGPRRLFLIHLLLWMTAVLLFGGFNALHSPALGVTVAIVVAFAGITTSAVAYLLTERILRPAAARALAEGPPRRRAVPGVGMRAVLAWALGTGVPVLGLVLIGASQLREPDADARDLAITMIGLGGVALTIGLLVAVFAAKATGDPIRSLRGAVSDLERGNLDAEAPVYDGTEVGLLQAGFNRMVAGLRERERIREAFGTYVDRDVAEHILSEGTDLSGEEVEVTVMFVDVRDFTGFAARSPAAEVVGTLNRLFGLVVPIVHAHGGHVDKFVGDGLLAVFGAPRRQPDHAERALRAALEIEEAVRRELGGELEIGIGLNSGPVIAGSIGGAGRLEFSVIGDVVNVAARVEAATRETGDTVLVAERTRELLDAAVELTERADIALRGKSERVSLYAPVTGAGEPPSSPNHSK